MKLKGLWLYNFRSYREETINFDNVTMAAIIGQNGSGKSTIIEALTFVYYGESIADSTDELSFGYDNATKEWKVEEFQVKAWFEMNDRQLSITRGRTKSGKTMLEFYIDGEKQEGSTLKELELRIEETLGVDYKSFVASVILKQNEYENLIGASPAECKKILMRILGIEDFEKRCEVVKKLGKEVDTQVLLKESRGTQITQELESIGPLKEKGKELKDSEAKLTTQKESLEATIERHNKEYNQLKTNYDNQSKNWKEKDDLKKTYDKYVMPRNDLDKKTNDLLLKNDLTFEQIDEKFDTFESRLVKIKQKIKELQEEWNKNSEKLSALKQERKGYEAQIEELEENKSVCLMEKVECNGLWKTNITNKVIALKERVHRIKNVDAIETQSQLDKIDVELERYKVSENRIAVGQVAIENRDKIKEYDDILKSTKEKLEKLNNVSQEKLITDDDVRAANTLVKANKEAKEEVEESLKAITTEIGKLQGKLERKKQLKEEWNVLDEEVIALRQKLEVYDVLVRAFGKDGVPVLIIENAIPALELDANDCLSRLTGGKIKLHFKLQKSLKGGGFSESFEILVEDGEGTRSVRVFSGGEKFRIVFAIHSAFSKYLTRRSGTQLKLLMIDEPCGLDDEGIEKFMEALGVIKNDYEQIMVISHVKELVESFPQVLYVEKTPSGSKVTNNEQPVELGDDI